MEALPPERATILLVSEPLRPSGQGTFSAAIVRGLLGAGLKPRLASPEPPPHDLFGPEERRLIESFQGMMSPLLRSFILPRMIEWAQQLEPSIVHGLSAFTAPVCQRLAAALDVPCVLSIHHYQTSGALRLDASCQAVMACSESIRENLVNDARVPKEIVRVVPIGIEMPALPHKTEADEERLPLVVTISKLTPRKDVATFIRAARQVLDVRGGACQFLIVGEGPEEPKLRKLARKLELEKNLTFAHAGIPHGQILTDADVYVLTSRAEGFGATALEAMAWARPVVATSVGGLIHLIRDGKTGFLVPVSDPGSVAGKIIDLLADPALRRRIGSEARRHAEQGFTLRHMVEGTVKVYAEVLGLVPAGTGIFRRPKSTRIH